jgi:hypothetical protein
MLDPLRAGIGCRWMITGRHTSAPPHVLHHVSGDTPRRVVSTGSGGGGGGEVYTAVVRECNSSWCFHWVWKINKKNQANYQ